MTLIEFATSILDNPHTTRTSVMDLGIGDGSFSHFASSLGYKVRAYDPSLDKVLLFKDNPKIKSFIKIFDKNIETLKHCKFSSNKTVELCKIDVENEIFAIRFIQEMLLEGQINNLVINTSSQNIESVCRFGYKALELDGTELDYNFDKKYIWFKKE